MFLLSLLVLSHLTAPPAAADSPLPVYCVEIPSLLYQSDDGAPKGPLLEPLKALSKMSGIPFEIIFASQTRSDRELESGREACAYIAAKTKDREAAGMRFVFKINQPLNFSIFTLSSRSKEFKQLSDLKNKKLMTFGTVPEITLQKSGFRYQTATSIAHALQMLTRGRADAIAISDITLSMSPELSQGLIKKAFPLASVDGYFTCSRSVKNKVIEALRKSYPLIGPFPAPASSPH